MLLRTVYCQSCAFLLMTIFSVTAFAQDAAPAVEAKEEAPKLETTNEKASYAIGYDIGRDLKRQGLELEPMIIAAGIAAALKGDESALTQEQVAEVFAAVREELQKKKELAEKKREEADLAFLEANKAKEGVKVTKSGLQYLVIKEGDGVVPKKSSRVKAHYRGTFVDGTGFDASYQGDAPTAEEEPADFRVTGVIDGWTEALQLMKVGAHYRLFIPGDLAYGAEGRDGIPPNAVLIFELYLVDSEG